MSLPSALSLVVLQSRGVGVLEMFQAALPRWAVAAFAAATHLGDTEVLLAVAFLAYLAYDRWDGAFVIGVLLVGYAVTVAAKAWFGLPRPPAELQFVAETGLGFPSGHAIGSTVAWGSLAVVLDGVSTARRRALAAGAVIAAVSISRVVIGVHYLVDVLAGVAVGLVVLAVAARWLRDEPLGLFGLAAALSMVAVGVSGASLDSLALLGGSIGSVTGWQAIEPTARPYGRSGLLAVGGAGVLAVGGVAVVDVVGALSFAGAGLLGVSVLIAPEVWERGRR